MDLNNIVFSQNQNSQFFLDTGRILTWHKPKSVSMILFMAVGGAGGGGGGYVGAVGTSRGGGGGGGSGSSATLLIPAYLIPDTLYFLIGQGGAGGTGGVSGGAAATAGSSGAITKIAINPSFVDDGVILLRSGSVAAVGGNAGGTGSAAAGAVETISTMTGWSVLGIFNAVIGSIGSAGNITAGANTFGNSTRFLGGSGGSGINSSNVDQVGGSRSTLTPYLNAIDTGGATGGGNGSSGITNLSLMLFSPGLGGGGGIGVGGKGGDGGLGCGGGGGGGSTATGGAGGRGGNGFIHVTCW